MKKQNLKKSLSDSSDEVDTFGTGIYECRKLEDHDWDNYLEIIMM